MNLRLAVTALSALVAGGGIAYLLLAPTVPTRRQVESVSTGKALIGGPFNLIDQTGKAVTEKDFHGRYMLVFFGYTYCPDVCPSGLQVISAALDQLGPDAEKITPLFISIDPARDTPEKMGAYVKSFHPRLIGLTGSAANVDAAVKAYRVYAKKVPDDKNTADYTMDHSSVVYLMGPSGELVTFAAEISKADVLAQQLRKGLAVKG